MQAAGKKNTVTIGFLLLYHTTGLAEETWHFPYGLWCLNKGHCCTKNSIAAAYAAAEKTFFSQNVVLVVEKLPCF